MTSVTQIEVLIIQNIVKSVKYIVIMTPVIKIILYIAGFVAFCYIVYLISRIQMRAWLDEFKKDDDNKSK
jgi:hypothetical protein